MTKRGFAIPFRRGKGAPSAPGTIELPPGESAPAAGGHPTLASLVGDIFSLVLTLKTATNLGEVTEVRKRVVALLDRFQSEARRQGLPSSVIDDAHFALVALLDESILNSGWTAGQGAWRILPLQQERLQIRTAGDEFFQRLERLRKDPAQNAEALELYFDCLALGFQGRFRLFGREKLDALVGELSRELAHGRQWAMSELSPRWRRPDDFSEVVGEGIPIWATALLFIPGALLLIVLFAVLARATSGSTASDLQELLSRMGS